MENELLICRHLLHFIYMLLAKVLFNGNYLFGFFDHQLHPGEKLREKERQTEGDRERQRERQRERDRETERGTERDREGEQE